MIIHNIESIEYNDDNVILDINTHDNSDSTTIFVSRACSITVVPNEKHGGLDAVIDN